MFEKWIHVVWQSKPDCVHMWKHTWCDVMRRRYKPHNAHNPLWVHNVSMYLCMCTCCEKQFVFSFFFFLFSPAECGRWSQAQSDTAIKQHLVEMGRSLLHLWPSGLSVCMGARVCLCVFVCVCPTASRSVGTPWPVRVMVPTWILCETRQKSRKTQQLEDAKEEKRFRQLWKYLLSEQTYFTFFFKFFYSPMFCLQKTFVTVGYLFCFFHKKLYYVLVRTGNEQAHTCISTLAMTSLPCCHNPTKNKCLVCHQVSATLIFHVIFGWNGALQIRIAERHIRL